MQFADLIDALRDRVAHASSEAELRKVENGIVNVHVGTTALQLLGLLAPDIARRRREFAGLAHLAEFEHEPQRECP